MRRVSLLLVVAVLVAVGTAAGQAPQRSRAAQFIAEGRGWIDSLEARRALTVLQQALQAQPTQAERVRAWTLFAIAQIQLNQRLLARNALGMALQLEPGLVVDSLSELAPGEVNAVFNEALAAAGLSRGAGFGVTADVPLDTALDSQVDRLRIALRVTNRARVVLSLTREGAAGSVIWGDTLVSAGRDSAFWNLRTRDGAPAVSGAYVLRVEAQDTLGLVAAPVERRLVLERQAVDTVALPPTPEPSAFAAETLHLRPGSPRHLLVGVLVGAAAYLMPRALGNPDLHEASTVEQGAYVAVGAAALSGLIGFLRSERVRAVPEAIAANRQLRADHEAQVRRVTDENAARRARARIRIRVETVGR